MPFINPTFLLHTDAARRLYDTYAAPQPIIDYHSHLPPKDIAENRRFANLFEIWLEGDHYKWRAMRANGVEERFCTGDASPYEKFLGLGARPCRDCLRNPLYHWTHLELARYFGIDDLLDETTAPEIWRRANERLASDALSDARHPAAVRRQGALHHRRSGRAAGLARPRSAQSGSGDQGLPDVPSRSRARRSRARRRSTRGSTGSAATAERRHRAARRPARRAARSATRPSTTSAAASRTTACSVLLRADPCTDAEAAATFDRARAGTRQHARTGTRLRLLHDAVLRPARRGEGLDQAAPPRRAAQRQHRARCRRSAATAASTRSATGRRPRRSAPTSIGSTRRARCRRPSSTTSTRRTTTRWRR